MTNIGEFVSTSKKLTQVRSSIRNANAFAYLLPTNDPFKNEYRAAVDERLAWLTGFDGSSGFGIVTLEKAAVFVDGRYTLQLQNQIDTTLFEPLPIEQRDAWVLSSIKAGDVVLFDPLLFSVSDYKNWQLRANQGGFTLMPTPVNLIDTVWADKPWVHNDSAFLHAIDYAGKTFLEKREGLIHFLQQHKADCLLIGNTESLNWLLNIRGYDLPYTPVSNMYGVFHKNGTIEVFCRLSNMSPEVRAAFGNEVYFHDISVCEAYLKAHIRGEVILVDPSRTPVALMSYVDCNDNVLSLVSDPCGLLRAIKNPTELRGFRQAHLRDGVALVQFLAWIAEEGKKGGVTEIDVADYLERCRSVQHLFHSLSFPTIAGAGANGAIVHYRATKETNMQVQPNQLLLIDSGAQYLDGTTDVTRTIAIGTPTAEQRDRFTRVLKGHIALAQAVFPYHTCGEQLDVLARQFLWQVGCDYNHGTGHGVGSFLNVHEGPQRIAKAGTRVPLQPGMILSNEPGYYKAGEYGIRIENLVVVVETMVESGEGQTLRMLAFETLTLAPIDVKLICVELLTYDEKDWLNRYHRYVYMHLAPHLDEQTRTWLQKATIVL